MAKKSNHRNRGLILTNEGLNKLQNKKKAIEQEKNQSLKYTLEQLHDFTDLALGTISKIFNQKTGVDRRTLIILFNFFDLELKFNDYQEVQSPDTAFVVKKTLHKRRLGRGDRRSRILLLSKPDQIFKAIDY